MKLSSTLKRFLRRHGINYVENAEFSGSIRWTVNFYIPDHDLVIFCMNSLDKFFELLFAAQDLMKYHKLSSIIVTSIQELPFKFIQLATSYDIAVIHVDELNLLKNIVDGTASVEEVNSKFKFVESRSSPKIASRCRIALLELLSKRPLTRDEIIESLSREYPTKTIEWCLTTLRRSGKIRRLAFLSGSRKAVYGVSENQLLELPKYYDLSRAYVKLIHAMRIVEALKKAGKGLTVTEISRLTQLKIPQVIASLKYLRGRGFVEKIVDDNNVYWVLSKPRSEL